MEFKSLKSKVFQLLVIAFSLQFVVCSFLVLNILIVFGAFFRI